MWWTLALLDVWIWGWTNWAWWSTCVAALSVELVHRILVSVQNIADVFSCAEFFMLCCHGVHFRRLWWAPFILWNTAWKMSWVGCILGQLHVYRLLLGAVEIFVGSDLFEMFVWCWVVWVGVFVVTCIVYWVVVICCCSIRHLVPLWLHLLLRLIWYVTHSAYWVYLVFGVLVGSQCS